MWIPTFVLIIVHICIVVLILIVISISIFISIPIPDERESAQADYEKMMADSADKRAQDSKMITDKSANKAKAEEARRRGDAHLLFCVFLAR